MFFFGAAGAAGVLEAVLSFGGAGFFVGAAPLVAAGFTESSLGAAAFGFGAGLTEESESSSMRGVGFGLWAAGAKTEVPGVLGSLGASLGALRTFHSGLTFGANLERDAVRLMVSSLKKMSKEMFGIWDGFGVEIILELWEIRSFRWGEV